MDTKKQSNSRSYGYFKGPYGKIAIVIFVILFAFVGYSVLKQSHASSADVNSDGSVNGADYTVIFSNFGKCNNYQFSDGNIDGSSDGCVGDADLGLLANYFNQTFASLTISPSTSSVQNGSNLIVTVNENSRAMVIDSVEADVAFDNTALQYVSSTTGTAFDSCQTTPGASVISFACIMNNTNTLAGSQTIGTITFKVLKTGSTKLTFNATSAIIQHSPTKNVWDTNPAGGSYTLTP